MIFAALSKENELKKNWSIKKRNVIKTYKALVSGGTISGLTFW